MSRTLKCGCVVSTTSDTDVRKGYSLSGGCIKRCDEHNGLIMNNTPPEALSCSRIRPCPACRGYELESRWCDYCKKRGIVLLPKCK